MSEMDVLRQIAEKTIKIPTPAGGKDNWLWDRTLRILRNAELVCRIPELADKNAPIDRFCLVAACYFADTGIPRYLREETGNLSPVSGDYNLARLRDFSSQIAAACLGPILPKPRVEKCCKIILESANRFTEIAEAAILSDARNLDDMGVVGLYHEFRKAATQGKGISEILDHWKRKIDYGYWQARLREGFRFETVRHLAARRLDAALAMMNHLAAEHDTANIDLSSNELFYGSHREPVMAQTYEA